MYNTMNGVNVADKLGLGSEVRELKFGSSFTSSGRSQQQGSFHSVRYDFKPASVDTSKMATLDVGPNGQVSISMPNVDGNGQTVFKGARKPYAKECVLIIDNETGEVVLEKLTHNIQVKRTREEGGSKKGGGLSAPVAPPPSTSELKKAPPSTSGGSFKGDTSKLGGSSKDREDSKKLMPPAASSHQHHMSHSSKRGPGNSPKPPVQHQRYSPNNGPSPGHSSSSPRNSTSPSVGSIQDTHTSKSSSSKHSQQPQHQQANLFSLTNFEDLLSMPPQMNPPAAAPKLEKSSSSHSHKETLLPAKSSGGNGNNAKNLAAPALSESSSGDDSSSSSSSDDDDDDSSDMEEVLDKVPVPPAPDTNIKSPVLMSSTTHRSGRPQTQPLAPSMPTDLLCEDLQLSESGSDSD